MSTVPAKRYLDRFDSAGRKTVPMFSGLMDYFPDACAALAEHSYKGNLKHNPGEPLHHARGKSMDHTDCIMRHLANFDGMDGDALEAVALFWRAGALCQEILERKFALTLPRGVTDPRAFAETNSLVGPNGEQAPKETTKTAEQKLAEVNQAIHNDIVSGKISVTERGDQFVGKNEAKAKRIATPGPLDDPIGNMTPPKPPMLRANG